MTKRIFLFTLVLFLFCSPFVIQASAIPTITQETEITSEQSYSSYLLPGQPLYFLKTWWETIRLFLTSDPIGKINYSIELIKSRLAESKTLLEQLKITQAEKNNERYQFQISETLEKIEQLKSDSQQVDQLRTKVAQETMKHQTTLINVYDKVPEEAKQGVLNAINQSEYGYQQATEAIESMEIKEKLTKEMTQIKNKLQLLLQKVGSQSRQQIKKGLEVLEKETMQGLENLGISD